MTPSHGGYVETAVARLVSLRRRAAGDSDMNEKKSMNNHLHVLEAYTSRFIGCPTGVSQSDRS